MNLVNNSTSQLLYYLGESTQCGNKISTLVFITIRPLVHIKHAVMSKDFLTFFTPYGQKLSQVGVRRGRGVHYEDRCITNEV